MPPPLIGGVSLAKLGMKALPWIAVFVAGFATASALEHNAPWGLAHQRNAALTDLGEARSAAGSWKKNRDGWYAYAQRLEAAGGAQNSSATDAVDRCSSDQATTAAQAFNNGYAAGRVAGRKTCGASNANPSPGGGVPAGPVSVRQSSETLAEHWADRAYKPPGALPAHR